MKENVEVEKFLWRQREWSICAVTAAKKLRVLCRKADHSRANVRSSKETSRTLGLSIANLIIKLEQLKIYNEIYSETEKRLKNIETALNLLQPSLDELNQKLSEPTFRRNIQLAAHNILCQNFVVRENLNKATKN